MGEHQVFLFDFLCKIHPSLGSDSVLHVIPAFRMFSCATQMNTSISQLRKISAHGKKDDIIFNNCSICLLWFAAKSVSLTCMIYPLAVLQAISYQLLISWRYLLELQPPLKKGTSRSGTRVAITAQRSMQTTSRFREEQASAYIVYSTQDINSPFHYIAV